jgi:hypothetical protein
LEHVKSHQDETKPFEELPLKAQLNCRADHIAEAYLAANPESDQSRVPRFQVNRAQLHLPGGTVT